MDEKTLRALVEAGAVKRVQIIADGPMLYIEFTTPTGAVTASTLRGAVKTWRTLDAAAKWVRSLGIGAAYLNVAKWQPEQKSLSL